MATAALIEKYRLLLTRLLPPGRAWEQVKRSALFRALAVEFARLDDRARDLLREMDPGTSGELLADWEQLLGIPDECTPQFQTEEERRLQARQKLGSRPGAMTKSFYEAVGSRLGFDITVTNAVPFTVGRATVGDDLTNDDPPRDLFTVGDHTVGQQLLIPGWLHFFKVNVPVAELSAFRVGINRVGEPLVTFGNELVECTIRKLKPAHTGVFFTFGG